MQLNVWSVYFYFEHAFLPKLFFPEGGVQNSNGNPGGVGGYFSGQKMEIPGRSGVLKKTTNKIVH